jgi:FkbM family methyltransferase
MRLSYAQCLEDFHLDLVLHDVVDGLYVDIGGGHPIADNVSYHFYLKGWRGIVVEPQADLAALYAHLRPRDLTLNHLIGATDGEVEFHVVDRLHGFSTIVEANAKGAAQFGAGYATTKHRIRPLKAIIAEQNITRIDVLKIDVEGAEDQVLAGMDWENARPRILCIEAIAPGSMADAWHAWEPVILANRYSYAFSDGLNRFYVADEHAYLADRFPKAPTPWEIVTHFYELGRPHLESAHPDRILTERLIKGFLADLPSKSTAEILAWLNRSAPKAGMETGVDLAKLIYGSADFPGADAPETKAEKLLQSDRAKASFGRIAAQYDGGMVYDE